MALFDILSVNAQSLNAFQKGIDLTNKNINNVYNKDYSREMALFDELPRYGVNMAEAHRVFDERYFKRYITENQNYNYHQELSSNLDNLEAMFNDITGAGLSADINEYFSSINDITNEPENMAARDSFLVSAQKFTSKLKDLYITLESEKNGSQLALKNEAKDINRLTSSLAKINKEIKASSGGNLIPDQERINTLYNERDRLVKELSSHIDTKIRYGADGSVDVSSAKGHALVVGDRNFELKVESVSEPELKTTSSRVTLNGADITNEFTKGTFAAKIEYTNQTVKTMDKLNTFAIEFAKQNNAIHQQGFNLDDETGLSLYDITGEDGSEHILNLSLAIDDARKLAVSSQTDSPGNNENFQALYSLKDREFDNLNQKSFYDYYIEMVGDIANSKDLHVKMAQESEAVLTSLDKKLQEISGVNMDEELMNLMQLQNAYQAAAKVINVTDELLKTVMGLIR